MFTLREMSASSSVESVPHAEPLPSVEYVLHGKPLSSVESLSSVELLSSVGSVPYGEPLPLTFDALALGRATRPKRRVYKKHYRGLCYFFGLIWDYTSLLICAMTIPSMLQPSGEHPKVPAGSQPADGVELWTMMIFHIRLSFRADEGIDVMCSQFLPPLTSVDEFGTVTMLDVQISGKTGKKKWIVLSLIEVTKVAMKLPLYQSEEFFVKTDEGLRLAMLEFLRVPEHFALMTGQATKGKAMKGGQRLTKAHGHSLMAQYVNKIVVDGKIFTVESKLDSICPYYNDMNALFGERQNFRPSYTLETNNHGRLHIFANT
ncbi:hypothetical protein DYB26_012462, partial [Aphanomyces astaci]